MSSCRKLEMPKNRLSVGLNTISSLISIQERVTQQNCSGGVHRHPRAVSSLPSAAGIASVGVPEVRQGAATLTRARIHKFRVICRFATSTGTSYQTRHPRPPSREGPDRYPSDRQTCQGFSVLLCRAWRYKIQEQ